MEHYITYDYEFYKEYSIVKRIITFESVIIFLEVFFFLIINSIYNKYDNFSNVTVSGKLELKVTEIDIYKHK